MMLCFAGMAQGGYFLDGIIGVVGKEVILKSDLEKIYAEYSYQYSLDEDEHDLKCQQDSADCFRTRTVIMPEWDCELHTLYQEEHLGKSPAILSAMKWFFEHEKEGIVLFEDCMVCEYEPSAPVTPFLPASMAG